RVKRSSGQLVIVDLVSPEDDALVERYNELERLRDPSHTRALQLKEFFHLFTRAGQRGSLVATKEIVVDLQKWLELTKTPSSAADQIRTQLLTEISGGPATGMRPFWEKDSLKFRQKWAILRAQ